MYQTSLTSRALSGTTNCLIASSSSCSEMVYSLQGNDASNNTTNNSNLGFRVSLLVIYIVALLGGTIGVFLMARFLKKSKNKISITTTSIINLVVAHSLFLLTLPFRIDYYATNTWRYPFSFCKLVSISIHIHLYLCFFFYMAILIVRLLTCLPSRDSYRPLIAFIASAAVWLLLMVSIFPATWLEYGKMGHYNKGQCFEFHAEIKKDHVKYINITIGGVVIAACAAVVVFQAVVLTKVVKSSQDNLWSQLNFRAQLKNLTFLSIMVFCLLPYHVFRIYYVLNIHDKISWHNEIYLSITTLCCLDLITFLAI
ncbi:hypothetical protein AAFF_G00001590 [Aldrovandia affinis]|uniref:G-protein coupled receptors family 1 profile domain-containing protein n=1 Tax=Aldrovandia affinis TaxID=143900 RepID=A0AAD7TD58_9TELE|nr:hypothetical protein AAFF_G00001590 [Aldrovandia affinis]